MFRPDAGLSDIDSQQKKLVTGKGIMDTNRRQEAYRVICGFFFPE